MTIELAENDVELYSLLDNMHKGEIVHITCNDMDKRNNLISLVGKKKKIDIIDIEKINSNLTVKDYIVFYTMVTSVYHDNTIDELTSLLIQNEMEYMLDTMVNALSYIEKIKIRCIAAYMKQINCLVGKGLLDELEQNQKEEFVKFLEENFVKNYCLCLLFDKIQ